jgi:voltage-gated potassium channel
LGEVRRSATPDQAAIGSSRPAEARRATPSALIGFLRELYWHDSARAHAFRYALLAFDVATVLFIVGSSFVRPNGVLQAVDALLGVVILADLAARLLISRRIIRDIFHWSTLADIGAVISFMLPLAGEGVAFLRTLRTLRLLHTYQVIRRLRADWPWFRLNEDAVIAVAHLLVFLFIITGLVYETQHRTNPAITNYVDALYFTVTALTTTGFGDITLEGTGGRLTSVLVMICGVTLFLRLAQILFRPPKVRYECPTCGLSRHDADAIHCKHCGTTVHIDTEGDV